MLILEKLAKACAILAGMLLTSITLMTCVSLIGRNTTGATLAGDFELTGVAAGAAIALFMPWCQLRRGNIIVDFFTAKASDADQRRAGPLRRPAAGPGHGAAGLAHGVGGLNACSTQSGTMMLGFPEWMVYVGMVPPLVLTAVIALYQACDGRRVLRRRPRMSADCPLTAARSSASCWSLMALRVPIAIAMFVAGAVGYVMQAGLAAASQLPQQPGLCPLCQLRPVGDPAVHPDGPLRHPGRHLKALFQFAAPSWARFKGGLAMAAVLACAAFGAICGSSVATAATITAVALPEMQRHGYSGRLSTGTLAAGGTLGILIPPSVPLVIYAILTEQNIAKLFAAAMVPGIIAMLGYMIAIAIYVRLVPGQAPEDDDDRAEHHAGSRCWASCRSRVIFMHRVRRHLRRPVHAHRRRGGGRGGHLRGGAAQARDHLEQVQAAASMPRPRARP